MTITLHTIANGLPHQDSWTSRPKPTSVAEVLALLDAELKSVRADARTNRLHSIGLRVRSPAISRDPITRLAPDFPLQSPGPRWHASVATSIARIFGCAPLFDGRGSNNVLLFGIRPHRTRAARMITTAILVGEEISIMEDAERLRRLVSRAGCAGTDAYRRGWLLGYADRIARHCREGWDAPEHADIRVLARLAAPSALAVSSGPIDRDPIERWNPCLAAGLKAGRAAGEATGARQSDPLRFDC